MHLDLYRMDLAQADLVEYYLRNVDGVRDVKVYDRTCDVIVRFAGERSGVLKAELTLGVLLSGQETDPVLTDLTHPQEGGVFWEPDGCVELRWSPPPEALQAHWRCPSALHQAGLLRSLGVTGVELGSQALEPPPKLPGLRVRRLDHAVVSVFPCRGDCAHCGGQMIQRAGKCLYSDRNLLLWKEGT